MPFDKKTYQRNYMRRKRLKIYPLVSVLDSNNQLVTVPVTKCDWCGKLLNNFDNFADNTIRVLYFCSLEHKQEFDEKYPPSTHSYPGIKLRLEGLNFPLKEVKGE